MPICDTTILIRVNPAPQSSGSSILSKEDYTLYTNKQGYFEISLITGLKITVTIPEANFQISGILQPGSIDVNKLDKTYTI